MQNFKPLLSDSSIRAFYARNPDDFVREKDELHLQQILVDNKKTADSLYALFRKGAAFDSVAAKLNRNEKDGENWDLGYVALDDLIPVLANKVKVYRVGKVTRPIRTDFGYHLFKIIDRKKKGSIKDFDAVRNDIVARLMQDQHEEKYRQLMGQLKSTTKIETNFQLLNTISLDSLFQARKKNISSSDR